MLPLSYKVVILVSLQSLWRPLGRVHPPTSPRTSSSWGLGKAGEVTCVKRALLSTPPMLSQLKNLFDGVPAVLKVLTQSSWTIFVLVGVRRVHQTDLRGTSVRIVLVVLCVLYSRRTGRKVLKLTWSYDVWLNQTSVLRIHNLDKATIEALGASEMHWCR